MSFLEVKNLNISYLTRKEKIVASKNVEFTLDEKESNIKSKFDVKSKSKIEVKAKVNFRVKVKVNLKVKVESKK